MHHRSTGRKASLAVPFIELCAALLPVVASALAKARAVANNAINPIDGSTADEDCMPGELEFLECGNVDNNTNVSGTLRMLAAASFPCHEWR